MATLVWTKSQHVNIGWLDTMPEIKIVIRPNRHHSSVQFGKNMADVYVGDVVVTGVYFDHDVDSDEAKSEALKAFRSWFTAMFTQCTTDGRGNVTIETDEDDGEYWLHGSEE